MPAPEPGPGQVLVRNHAVGVNPVDTYLRSNTDNRGPKLPYTPGSDAAGVVEAIGAGVTGVKAGDRVYFGGSLSGAYAELSLCDQAQVHPLPDNTSFAPLMTLYLTDNMAAAEIVRARKSGFIVGVKYYPAGATTNSDSGVTRLERVHAPLAAMEEVGMPLLVHGEVTDPDIDVFDRERYFIDRVMTRILRDFPGLIVVFEHITTREAAEFVADSPARVGATITPHHRLWSRNAMLAGAIRPHYYCLPILKREAHRAALVRAATSGNPKYFLGSDSAPHAKAAKEKNKKQDLNGDA